MNAAALSDGTDGRVTGRRWAEVICAGDHARHLYR